MHCEHGKNGECGREDEQLVHVDVNERLFEVVHGEDGGGGGDDGVRQDDGGGVEGADGGGACGVEAGKKSCCGAVDACLR